MFEYVAVVVVLTLPYHKWSFRFPSPQKWSSPPSPPPFFLLWLIRKERSVRNRQDLSALVSSCDNVNPTPQFLADSSRNTRPSADARFTTGQFDVICATNIGATDTHKNLTYTNINVLILMALAHNVSPSIRAAYSERRMLLPLRLNRSSLMMRRKSSLRRSTSNSCAARPQAYRVLHRTSRSQSS